MSSRHSPLPPVATTPAGASPALPSFLEGYAAIHAAMRRDGVALPLAIEAIDRPRSLRAARHWFERFATSIETHHHREDDTVWPDLVERSPGFASALAQLDDDHAELDRVLAEAREALAAPWDRFHRATAVDAARRLASLLLSHLDREEEAAFPRLAASYTADEYRALEQEMIRGTSLAHLAFEVPWVLEGQVDDRLEALLPVPIRVVHRLVFAPRYRRTSALIRAARPHATVAA